MDKDMIPDFHIELLSCIHKELVESNIKILEKYDGEYGHISNGFTCQFTGFYGETIREASAIATAFVSSLKNPSKILFLKNPHCPPYRWMHIEYYNIKYRYTQGGGVFVAKLGWEIAFKFLKFDDNGELMRICNG